MGHYSFEHVFFFFYARWAGKCKRNAGKFCHTKGKLWKILSGNCNFAAVIIMCTKFYN